MAARRVGAAAGGDRDSCWWSQGRNMGGNDLGSGGKGHSRFGRAVGCPTDPALWGVEAWAVARAALGSRHPSERCMTPAKSRRLAVKLVFR